MEMEKTEEKKTNKKTKRGEEKTKSSRKGRKLIEKKR